MKRLVLYPILATVVFFTACKKDGPDTPATTAKVGFLTNGTWRLSAVVSDDDGNGSYETDDFATYNSCFTDGIITFKSNLQFEFNEGPTKCDPADSQIETGTWSLINNENDIKIDTDVYSIVELSNTTLKWREDGPANTSSIVTLTKR